MTQGIHKQIRVLPAVKPEAHFFEVGLEMLRTEFMPATAQAALEKRERGLDGVCVRFAPNVSVVPCWTTLSMKGAFSAALTPSVLYADTYPLS